MKKGVVVIGGGPAGMVSALTAHRYYPEKDITLIKNVEKGVIPCGIPYMVSSMGNPEENGLSMLPLEKAGIEIIMDEVKKINRKEKSVSTEEGNDFPYEKLVLALGSKPFIPPILGVEKEGIYQIEKEMGYLKKMVATIRKSRNVLVVGGGFIGVEFADEISKIKGTTVYLVEMFPRLLLNSFDLEFGSLVEEKLESEGVKVLTNKRVIEFVGDKRVEKAKFEDGETVDVDCVILGIGSIPNSDLAVESGLDMTKKSGIWVDEYMRTNDPDIFAVGDCALKRDFFTRREVLVMLASTATSEARVAGASLYNLRVVRENKGALGIYSTYVDGLALGSAGLTEGNARKEGFEITIGNFEGIDKHPAALPNANKIKIKLIFSSYSGIIMGGQVAGGESCGELINAIGIAIQKRVSFSELETLQIATHPRLTSAPTKYPIVLAANDAASKMLVKQ